MKAIVFDLDGTLVDSAPDIHRCVNLVLAGEGLPPLSLATVRSFIGNGAPVLIDRVMEASGLPRDPALRLGILTRFLEHYETAVDLTTLYDGVQDCLRSLQSAGFRIGICTNKPMGPTMAVLAHFGLRDFFAVVIGGDTLPVRKPDPAPLLRCIADLGAEKALFVGDSEVDAATAENAGMAFALFSQGYRMAPIDSLSHDVVFDHFDKLTHFALQNGTIRA